MSEHMGLLDKIRFSIMGRTMPVMRVSEVEPDGKIHTFIIGERWTKDPNTLTDRFSGIAATIPPGKTPIGFQAGSKVEYGYAVHNGSVIDLYTVPPKSGDINLEETKGGLMLGVDILSKIIGLGRAYKYMIIGGCVGIVVGWMMCLIINRIAA